MKLRREISLDSLSIQSPTNYDPVRWIIVLQQNALIFTLIALKMLASSFWDQERDPGRLSGQTREDFNGPG
jgi:hypothetical protein